MTYKKLFPIEYNNKKFMIFIDENNRRTFLEINSENEYEYPMLEDFVALNQIFNTKDPFICYAIPKFNFKECVKVAKKGVLSLLTVITIINSMPTALATTTKVDVQDDTVSVSINSTKKEIIRVIDLEDLDKYLGQLDVTKEMVLKAIDENPNLQGKYNRIAKDLLNTMLRLYPNTNLRIFYENIKTLNIKEYTEEEYKKANQDKKGSIANYKPYENVVSVLNTADTATICHELYHAFNTLCLELEDKIIARFDENRGMSEPLTDIGAGKVTPSKYGYIFTRAVTNYLMTFVDYTIEDFNELGTEDLINKLKAKYPNIDIDYIKETLNTYNLNAISTNQEVKIDDMEDLRNELFKICLQEANLSSGYTPFNNFAKIFSDAKDSKLIINYFEEYNTKLKELGYSNIITKEDILKKLQVYSNIVGIGVLNNEVCPIEIGPDQKYLKINPDGTNSNEIVLLTRNIQNIYSLLSSTVFSDYNIFGTDEYWHKLNDHFGYISPHRINPIPIYMNGKLVTTAMPKDLVIKLGFNNDKAGFIISNLQGETIYKTDNNLTNLSQPLFFSEYIKLLSKYITRIDLEDILNLEYINNHQIKFTYDNSNDLAHEDNKTNKETPENTSFIIENNSISEIYINNEVIAKANVKDLILAIGKTQDGIIGYILTNKAGMPIYESAEVIEELSNPINFEEYTGPGFSKMYLEDYLNETYLSNFQKETGKFNNLELTGDKIVIDNSVKIIIQSKVNDRVINSTYKLSKLKIYIKNGVINLSSITNTQATDSYDLVIDAEDILKYSNMLDEGVSLIRLTIDDLMEMTEKYINDLNSNLDKESIIR